MTINRSTLMKNSFVLSKTSDGAIGIFATVDIKKGKKLKLFRKGDYKLRKHKTVDSMPKAEVFAGYCVKDETGYHGPKDWNRMSIGWYIRHSKNPSTRIDAKYDYFASHKIKVGEELTIDMRTIGDERHPPMRARPKEKNKL